jgi:hypothetical protein
MDFTDKDGAAWPMYVSDPRGELYNFCPGKAQWDEEAKAIYRLLIISAETGTMLQAGGLEEQPEWWIELLSFFLVRYDQTKFYSRASAILGDPNTKTISQGVVQRGK